MRGASRVAGEVRQECARPSSRPCAPPPRRLCVPGRRPVRAPERARKSGIRPASRGNAGRRSVRRGGRPVRPGGLADPLHRPRSSGGERQRGRHRLRPALPAPPAACWTKPLAGLDSAAKVREILPYLERLHAAVAIPVVYVSHDLAEIARLADHLIVMRAGARRSRSVGTWHGWTEATTRSDGSRCSRTRHLQTGLARWLHLRLDWPRSESVRAPDRISPGSCGIGATLGCASAVLVEPPDQRPEHIERRRA